MAKYLPNYKYDVFMSYAHKDDILDGKPPGWVTDFRRHVEDRLAQILPRQFDMWMDHDLEHEKSLTPRLIEIVNDTAVLLVVLSPSYAASEWCRRERNAFLDKASSKNKVIVVEREKYNIYDEDGPDLYSILDRKIVHFWNKDENGEPRILQTDIRNNQLYINRVDDVAKAIARALRDLEKSGVSENNDVQIFAGTESAVSDPQVRKVFIAHVTDDLEHVREDVIRRLEESRIPLLPHGSYSLNPSVFKASAQQDMAQCHLFVQLLNGTPGKKPPDLPGGYDQLQLDLAREAGLEILQWRSPELKLDELSIPDPDLRALLDSPTVRAESLEDFKTQVVQSAHKRKVTEEALSEFTEIFVDTDITDEALADKLEKILDSFGVHCSFPMMSTDNSKNRKYLEKKLNQCDGLIVAFENAPMRWVERHLDYRERALGTRSVLPTLVFSVSGENLAEIVENENDIRIVNASINEEENFIREFVEGLK